MENVLMTLTVKIIYYVININVYNTSLCKLMNLREIDPQFKILTSYLGYVKVTQ